MHHFSWLETVKARCLGVDDLGQRGLLNDTFDREWFDEVAAVVGLVSFVRQSSNRNGRDRRAPDRALRVG